MIEQRASIENPSVPLSHPDVLALIFGDAFKSSTGITVTTEKALGVPTVWAAVNLIADTIATLPLQLFHKPADGAAEVAKSDPLYTLLHDVVNEDKLTSFKWRKLLMTTALTGGRAYTYIERNKAQRAVNLWPLDPANMEIKRADNRTRYHFKDDGKPIVYEAGDILDIPFMLATDGLSHRSPIATLKNALGLAIAMEQYASRFFQNGGVPPLALEGPQASSGAVSRATTAIEDAVKRAIEENRNILYMPAGHKLAKIAFNPEEAQLIKARAFQLLEIARIYGVPPVFLQDLTFGTYSNSEQQDLHYVKHTISHWLKLLEQEINAKLFSSGNRKRFAEFNVDGLLRGDFKTRMDGMAAGVQNALRTPNEGRAKDNLKPLPGGDQLFINSASVPIDGLEAGGEGNEGDDDE